MEEYTKLIKEISTELWKTFLPMIEIEKTDDFYTGARKIYSDIADKYKGTVAEGYAVDMAVFYMMQVQRIDKKDNKHGKWGELWDALEYLRTGVKPL